MPSVSSRASIVTLMDHEGVPTRRRSTHSPTMSGRLVLCGTPIGNLEDASLRMMRVLGEADVIACEDTRRTRKLLSHHGIDAPDLVVYNDGNERRKTPDLVRRMSGGQTVALVSDAGMPGLSDPGYHLVRACVEASVPVEVVPGPTAAISALALSGLPPRRFVFEGFLPRKKGERARRIESLEDEERTIVIYVSPHRIEEHLGELLASLGDRPGAIAREITKLHEEVRRGTLTELLEGVRIDPPRGEMVVVVGGATGRRGQNLEPDELAARARALMDDGWDRKEALVQVARATGVARRAVFDALVAERKRES